MLRSSSGRPHWEVDDVVWEPELELPSGLVQISLISNYTPLVHRPVKDRFKPGGWSVDKPKKFRLRRTKNPTSPPKRSLPTWSVDKPGRWTRRGGNQHKFPGWEEHYQPKSEDVTNAERFESWSNAKKAKKLREKRSTSYFEIWSCLQNKVIFMCTTRMEWIQFVFAKKN